MEISKVINNGAVESQTVMIPFGFSYTPIKKLALINFEKNPDQIYVGLELQYLEGEPQGVGYRIIAYRQDGYVDVYDDINLKEIEGEDFDVAGKGLGEKKRVAINHSVFQKKGGCLWMSFEFLDKMQRNIRVNIAEETPKKTKPINLLAPIGSSTEKPSYLPLFFLYEFDFVRRGNTVVDINIDGKLIKLDPFPFKIPKDFQWRYYTRYTPDCQIIEFANAANCKIEEIPLNSNGTVTRGPLEYQYCSGILKKIVLNKSNHSLVVEFALGFPDLRKIQEGNQFLDTFKIITDEVMGYLSGEYTISRKDNIVEIELIPSGGWTTTPNSYFTKMMFGKKSVFCSWPKTYRYTQKINIETMESVSNWERIRT